MPYYTGPGSWALAQSEKPKKARTAGTLRAPDLADDEAANTKRALAHLKIKYRGYEGLSRALSLHVKTIKRVLNRRGRPGAGMALRIARLTHVAVEDVLSGKWPGDRCPHCGRS